MTDSTKEAKVHQYYQRLVAGLREDKEDLRKDKARLIERVEELEKEIERLEQGKTTGPAKLLLLPRGHFLKRQEC